MRFSVEKYTHISVGTKNVIACTLIMSAAHVRTKYSRMPSGSSSNIVHVANNLGFLAL